MERRLHIPRIRVLIFMALVLINPLGVSHPNTPKKKAETEKENQVQQELNPVAPD